MRGLSCWILFSMIWISPALLAQESKVDCQSARFTDAVLARFPRVREACLDVITRDGAYYAVFRAKLLGVSHGTVRIRPKLPDGTFADARRVEVREDRRVLVNGQPMTFSELTLGQELMVYIKVREPLVVFPPADPGEAWVPAPLEDIRGGAPPPSMPVTASGVPLVGAGAVGLLFIAFCLSVRRDF